MFDKKEYHKQYYQQNKERYKTYKEHLDPEYYKIRYRKAKDRLFDILGGKVCIKCGINDERCLQFDHINGGGQKELKENSATNLLFKYLKDPEIKNKLQVLCANCNWIKRYENGENRIKAHSFRH